MSNILPSIDRFHNPLTSYPPSNPSLSIWLSPSSSSSMYSTKANRKIADSLDPMVGFSDSKTPTETMRRNILVALGVERLNSSEKPRKTKCLPLPSSMMTLSPGFHHQTHKQSPLCGLHSRYFRGPPEACTYCCSTFLWISHLQGNSSHYLTHQVDGCWGHTSGSPDPGSHLCKGLPDQHPSLCLAQPLCCTLHSVHSLGLWTRLRVLQVGCPRFTSCRWQQ